ncbi:hypothetical protein ACFX15_030949 [Malus domestica]
MEGHQLFIVPNDGSRFIDNAMMVSNKATAVTNAHATTTEDLCPDGRRLPLSRLQYCRCPATYSVPNDGSETRRQKRWFEIGQQRYLRIQNLQRGSVNPSNDHRLICMAVKLKQPKSIKSSSSMKTKKSSA